MKKFLSLIIALSFILMCQVNAEGLLPGLTEIYGVEMPSFTAISNRFADTTETLEDGSGKVTFKNVTESDFDAFSDYMDEFGCELIDYSIDGSIFNATIGKQGASFTLSYNQADGTLILVYPQGTSEEDEKEALIRNLGVGDIYIFGSYEQDNNASNGKEPIEWIVLDVNDDGSLVLISRYALDCKPYNTKWTGVTWETCTLRKWLNNDFYNAAFNADERSRIVTVHNINEDNPSYGTKGGNATDDNVWLLSINEVTNRFTSDKVYGYFTDNDSRMCAPTKYAVAQGAWQSDSYKVDDTGVCWWWLRSSGNLSYYAAYVLHGGYVSDFGSDVTYSDNAVRPVVCVQPS